MDQPPPTHLIGARVEQFCPVALAVDALQMGWMALLVRDLLWEGPLTHDQLARLNPVLDDRDLDRAILELETLRFIDHVVINGGLTVVLTETGRSFESVINSLHQFGLPLLRRVPMSEKMLHHFVGRLGQGPHPDLVDITDPLVVSLDVAGRVVHAEIAQGSFRVVDRTGRVAATSISCTNDTFVDIVLGALDVRGALDQQMVQVSGSSSHAVQFLEALRPSS